MSLPTVQECREFLGIVNAGRVAGGLEPIEYLDFDNAEPSSSSNCLSARNLFWPLSEVGVVGTGGVMGTGVYVPEMFRDRLAKAIGTTVTYYGLRLPDSILCVTDPFDYSAPGLRDRLVEAGVVE